MTNPERPRCTENRKDGQPCAAYATATGKCAGHSRLGAVSDPQANAAKSAQIRSDKAEKRKLSFQDLAAKKLEKNADKLVAVFLDAAKADIPTTTGYDKDGSIAWEKGGGPDHAIRLRAAQAFAERVLGKPVERVETVETNASSVSSLSREQRAALRRRLVEENPDLAELVPKGEVG